MVLVDRNNVQHDTILMVDTLTITGGIKCASNAKTKTKEQKSYQGDAASVQRRSGRALSSLT